MEPISDSEYYVFVTPQIMLIPGASSWISVDTKGLLNPQPTFHSLDDHVVTVDEAGMIEAHNPGFTDIEVEIRAENIPNTIFQYVQVSVEIIPIELRLTPARVTLLPGQQERVNVTLSPEPLGAQEFEFWLSDENIASFDTKTHVVKGIQPGTTILNAIYWSGSNELTARCTIVVEED